MGLPKKASRTITVGDVAYRWVVSTQQAGHLRVVVERRDDPGQRLVAWFHYHDAYARDPAGRWHRVGQGRGIGPGLVRAAIELGLEKGWKPDAKSGGAFDLWDAGWRFPVAAPTDPRQVRLAEFANGVVGDLRYHVSVDIDWRRKLFNSTPGERFEVPYENEHGLHFAAFFDGWAGGMWVIGIECVEFPSVSMHTFNGPAFL
jgi:hypothetical protein